MTNKNQNFIELKYHKNSKQEIVFENLDEIKEGDNVVLRLKDGDCTPFIKATYSLKSIRLILINYPSTEEFQHVLRYHTKDGIDVSLFDSSEEVYLTREGFCNILAKWNIPEDSAVLFLSDYEYNKGDKIADDSIAYFTYPNIVNEDDLPQNCYNIGNYEHISIIANEVHAEDKNCQYHIENINKVCKELKEKYGVKRIELFVSHCFVEEWLEYLKWQLNQNDDGSLNKEDYFNEKNILIDKITTTNSTGILEVQKSHRLEVVDCVEFFKLND